MALTPFSRSRCIMKTRFPDHVRSNVVQVVQHFHHCHAPAEVEDAISAFSQEVGDPAPAPAGAEHQGIVS